MDPVDVQPSAREVPVQETAPAPRPPAPETTVRPERTLRSAPERREVALILGLVLLLNLVPGGVLQLLNLRWGLLATQLLFVAAPVLLAIRWFYLDRSVVLPLRAPRAGSVAGAALGIIGLNHVLNYGQAWQEQFFPMPRLWRDLFISLTTFHGPVDFVLLLLLVGVVPGVCEELLFRGFVQTGLKRAFDSDAKAIVAGAAVFAGFHLNPWSFTSLMGIGLYLGFLVWRTRSLVPAMVAHALNNILSLILASLDGPLQETVLRSTWAHLVAGGCVAAAALLLRRAPG